MSPIEEFQEDQPTPEQIDSRSSARQAGDSSFPDLARKFVAYAFSVNAQRFFSLLLIPVFVRVLTVDEYGIYETALVTISLFSILLNAGMTQSIVRFFASAADVDKRHVIGVGLGVTCATILLAILVFTFSQNQLASLILGNAELASYLWLVLQVSIILTLNLLLQGVLRSEERVGLYVVFIVLSTVGMTAMVIILMFLSLLNLTTVFVSYIISYLLLSVYLLPTIISKYGVSWSWSWLKKMTAFGIPMLPIMISHFVIRSADRYFILHFSNLSALAIYGLGYRLGSIFLLLLVMPLNYALGPHIYRGGRGPEQINGILSHSFTIYLLAALFLGYLLIAFAPEMVGLLATSKYSEASQVIPYIIMAQFFIGINFWASAILQLERKTLSMMIATLITGALNLTLNFFLVPSMSWRGAALSAIISNALLAMLLLVVVARVHPVRLEWRRVLHLFICATLVFAMNHVLEAAFGHIWCTPPLVLVCTVAFLAITGFFSVSEWKWIKRLLSLPGRLML